METEKDNVSYTTEQLPDSIRWTDSRGTVVYTQRAPGVVLIRYERFITRDIGNRLLEELDREIKQQGMIEVFHDAEAIDGWDGKWRQEAVDWINPRKSSITSHMFIRSKLAAMAISVANLLLGDEFLQSHSNRASFTRALYEAVYRRKQ